MLFIIFILSALEFNQLIHKFVNKIKSNLFIIYKHLLKFKVIFINLYLLLIYLVIDLDINFN
jgi:hypothetical protein